ncbi:Hsp70 family protein [Streptomyces paradoxus]
MPAILPRDAARLPAFRNPRADGFRGRVGPGPRPRGEGRPDRRFGRPRRGRRGRRGTRKRAGPPPAGRAGDVRLSAVQLSAEGGHFLVGCLRFGVLHVEGLQAHPDVLEGLTESVVAAVQPGRGLARSRRKLGSHPERLTRQEARRWRRHVELTKIALSQPETDQVLFEPLGGLRPVVIHREEFEQAVEPLVRRALVPLEECLRDVGLAAEDLDAVLMIGGTSQIPLVRTEVERVLGAAVVDSRLCKPMTAVARGAAITAAEIDGLIPETAISVATSHDLGLSFEAGGRRGFAPLIPRYSTLPARGTRSAMPAVRGASKVVLEIVEGDGERAADDERTFPLARLELPVPQPNAEPSSNVFDVDYHYDRSGILKVHATARHTGTVMLDEELDCFGPDGTPIAQGADRELERLLRRIDEPAPRPASSAPPETGASRTEPETWEEPAGEGAPALVVDGRGIMTAGRSAASPRPPSMRLLGSALHEIRRRYAQHHVVAVIGTDLVDLVEYDEQELLERAVQEGLIVTVPSASPQAVLSVAQQLNAVVVSMDDLRRLRLPYPWAAEKERFVKLARVERHWVFT